MDDSEFRERVTDSGPIEDPEPITEATLETLGETLSSGQAEDVATHLPDAYASTLTDTSAQTEGEEGGTGSDGAVTLSRMEFVERVRDRASEYASGSGESDDLEPRVEAVTEALQGSIPREEQRGLRSQLPDDVEACSPAGSPVDSLVIARPTPKPETVEHADMQENEFYSLVQEAGHLESMDRAQAASEAVLATLGEALTAGEAEDVAAQLPDELARIMEDADHDGAGYGREEFVDRVGEHLRGTDVEPDDAEQFADAVTDAVAAALTEGEVEDLKGQLDEGLQPLFEDVTVDPEHV